MSIYILFTVKTTKYFYFVYSKNNEGSVYIDGTKGNAGKEVAAGATFTYHWFVPERAAPGPNDGPCLTWAYYSGANAIKDTNTGLIGPLITCRKVLPTF